VFTEFGADLLQIILETLAAFGSECSAGEGEGFDAIQAEGAEVVAGLAPGKEGPNAGPKGQGERADRAALGLGGSVCEAGVGEGDYGAAQAGGVELIEQAAVSGGHLMAGSEERDGVQPGGELGRQDSLDASERRACGGDGLCAAPGLDEAGAEDEGCEFFRCEHEGREIEVATKGIADAGLAFDGLAVELEVADVAVDGALRDLEPLGEGASGLQATGAEELDYAEEAIGASHGFDDTASALAAVEADVVALGVEHAGVEGVGTGNLSSRQEDGVFAMGASEDVVELAINVEEDHGAVGGGLMAGALDEGTSDFAFGGWEDEIGLVAGPLLELDVEDCLVELYGAIHVGGGDFEPGGGVAFELAHGMSPVRWGELGTGVSVGEGC
jgi:hypothetical protein